MFVVQHYSVLIRIVIRLGKGFFVFQWILNGTYSNLLQHLGWYLSTKCWNRHFDHWYTATV